MPPKGPQKGKRGRKGRKDNEEQGGGGGGGYAPREIKLIKPPDQEKLTESQLKEEIQRCLVTTDPTVMKDRVIWDYREKTYVPVPVSDETVTIFHLDSELVPKDQVEEFKKVYPYPLVDVVYEPVDDPKQKPEAKEATVVPSQVSAVSTATGATVMPDGVASVIGAPTDEPPEKRPSMDGDAAEQEEKKSDSKPEEDEEDKDDIKEDTRQTKFLNQFDFSDRSTQTYNNPLREHACQTQPPPRSQYKDYCNAWIIYDAYEADMENRPKQEKQSDEAEQQQGTAVAEGSGEGTEPNSGENSNGASNNGTAQAGATKEKEGKIAEREKVKMRKASVIEGQAAQEAALNKSAEGLKILERLVMQNVHNEVLFDFKYYEDASDEFRETGEGTILPLWKFAYDKAKRLHVTGISWSQSEPDMFAVSYGSFSFTHPVTDGMVLIWSLRNPAFPEHVWISPRGVMCCAVHPNEGSLIAVGMYDGNVALIQLQPDENNATSCVILKNVHVVQKHRSPIWSVKWGEDDMDGEPNFYSSGLDGRIIHWSIDTSDSGGVGGLGGTEICTLHLPVPPVSGPDGTTYKLFGCARVLAFHPSEKTTFLVGTAEGNIFRCSSLYGSRFQQIYNAHFLPVAALEWNYYHKDVFISCSEDWTIKIWDKKDPEPMYVFEIGVAILDCSWAPYSSTVFAAVTEEGKALVYDLNVNKEKPICCQQIVTKKKVHPNRVQFNPFYAILCIGDDRGQLTTLKLSPNLRLTPKDARGTSIEGESKTAFEIQKMTKLLSLVRDPETYTNTKSLARPDEKQVKTVLSAMQK